MKAYVIKVGKVTADRGFFTGYEIIAYVDSKEKVEAKKEAYKKEHQKYEYWMTYQTDENKEIKFFVDEITIE